MKKFHITPEMQRCEHEGEVGSCCAKCELPSSVDIGDLGWDAWWFEDDDELEED